MDKAMHSEFEGHTPGPWKKIKDDMGWTIFAPNAVSTFDSRTKVVCVLPNHELDATLIAAAPDLLKENQSLRSELQKQKESQFAEGEALMAASKVYAELARNFEKQKELNAELVKGLEYIKKLLGALSVAQDTPEGQAYYTAESLIKKYKES